MISDDNNLEIIKEKSVTDNLPNISIIVLVDEYKIPITLFNNIIII